MDRVSWKLAISGILILGMSLALFVTFIKIALTGGIFIFEKNMAVLIYECVLTGLIAIWGIYLCGTAYRRRMQR